MEPIPHTPEYEVSKDTARSRLERWRRRRERERARRAQEAVVYARPRQPEAHAVETHYSTTEALEDDEETAPQPPRRRRARVLGRVAEMLTGERRAENAARPRPRTEGYEQQPQPPIQLEQAIRLGKRVEALDTLALHSVDGARTQVLNASAYDQPAERQQDMLQVRELDRASANLELAKEELHDAIGEGQDARAAYLQPDSFPAPDFGGDNFRPIESVPSRDPAYKFREALAAEEIKRKAEQAKQQASAAQSAAVIGGVIGGASYLHSRTTRKQVTEVRHEQRDMRAQLREQAEKLEASERTIQQLRTRSETAPIMRRREVARNVVRLAERQVDLSHQSAERIHTQAQKTVERPLGRLTPEKVKPVVKKEGIPESIAESYHYEQRRRTPEAEKVARPMLERVLNVNTAELPKAPTERELSDRAERQPGLGNMQKPVHASDKALLGGKMLQQLREDDAAHASSDDHHATPRILPRPQSDKNFAPTTHISGWVYAVLVAAIVMGLIFILKNL